MKQYIFLLLIIIFALGLPFIFNIAEGFSNYSLEKSASSFPESQTQILVQDTYPPIGKNQTSDNSASDIWREYPIFPLGSYDQITNNIRYPDNPDNGTCMPASMCGALYYDKKIGNNYITPLPPNNSDSGIRVGYFTTNI